MATDSKKRIANIKRIKPAMSLLPASIFLLFSLVVFYSARHHTVEDQRAIINNELKRNFPQAELIAPTMPPKRWDEKSKSWQPPKEQLDEQEKHTRLQFELERLRKLIEEQDEARKVRKNRR